MSITIGQRKQYDLKEGDDAVFSAGSKKPIKIDTLYHLNGLLCILTINHDNGASAAWNDPKLLSAINSISLVANGSEHFKTITPVKIYANELKNFGRLAAQSIDESTGTGLTSTYSFMIPFSMIKMMVPDDTILDTNRFNSLNLFVQWADKTALGTDITINSGSLSVYSMGIRDHLYNLGEPIKYFIENSIVSDEVIVADQNDFPIYLPKDKFYKGFVISAKVDGVFDDAVIENIIVKSGSTVFVNWSAAALRAKNVRELDIKDETLLKGLYYVDPTQRGRITDMYNIDKLKGGYNKISIHLTVKKGAGLTTVDVSSDEIEFTEIIPNPVK